MVLRLACWIPLLAIVAVIACDRHLGADADARIRCGDGVAQGQEECDGDDLLGQNCAGLGFDSGSLECAATCQWDTTSCIPIGTCGDEYVQRAEECDGDNLAGADCATLGWDSGMLRCGDDCRYDPRDCCDLSGCGDAFIGCGEECDYDYTTMTPVLGGATCESEGYDGGTLDCLDCVLAVINCCDNGQCGDGVPHCGEECEIDNNGPYFMHNETCESLGFSGGTLGCVDCTIDASSCY